MLKELKAEANMTCTENGAVTLRSTGSACFDLFASIGALRNAEEAEITTRFLRAFAEDPDLAMKILFYARDVRGGLGERRVFRVIMKWLAENEPAAARRAADRIAEYGRWDDLFTLENTPCEARMMEIIREQLASDEKKLAQEDESISLLGKWMPSVNASNDATVRRAKHFAHALGMRDVQYRKLLTRLRARIRILENNLREKDYTFSYEAQPSKAMFKYRAAFLRNDRERYFAYMRSVERGDAKMHAGTLMPYEIITPLMYEGVDDDQRRVLDAAWNAQEDFVGDENALAVIDGSGSMYWGGKPVPAAVAMSLGIWFAQRNTGAFHQHFITFSKTPQLVEIKGDDIMEKVRCCMSYNEIANTDLQKVFELILNAALRNNVPQEEMPSALYIISDMEFDSCVSGAELTNFEYAKQLFREHGYELPRVVFWNVCSRNEQQPVSMNEQGVALVSGASASVFSLLVSGALTPYAYMMQVLSQERYRSIAA